MLKAPANLLVVHTIAPRELLCLTSYSIFCVNNTALSCFCHPVYHNLSFSNDPRQTSLSRRVTCELWSVIGMTTLGSKITPYLFKCRAHPSWLFFRFAISKWNNFPDKKVSLVRILFLSSPNTTHSIKFRTQMPAGIWEQDTANFSWRQTLYWRQSLVD